MLLGRVILGLGGESLVVAQLAILTHSFPAPGGTASLTTFPSQGVALAMQLMVTRAATLGTFMLLPAAYDSDHLATLAKHAQAALNGARSVKLSPSAFEAGPGSILVGIAVISLAFAIVLLFLNGCSGYATPSQLDLLACLRPKGDGSASGGDAQASKLGQQPDDAGKLPPSGAAGQRTSQVKDQKDRTS